jgi:hypothetical protein
VFALAGILALLIAWVTVSFQSIKAAFQSNQEFAQRIESGTPHPRQSQVVALWLKGVDDHGNPIRF